MQDQSFNENTPKPKKRPSRVSWGIIAGVSALVLAVGGGSAWWAWQTMSSKPSTVDPTTSAIQPSSNAIDTIPTEKTAQIYWLKDTGTKLELVPSAVSLETASQPQDILKTAFQELLKGPTDTDVASTIPTGTELHSLEVRDDGVHVDLSQEFETGGGSASMSGRLGQIVYTASSLDPDANVWISIEGKPLELLGGEGLEVSQPMTRAEFDQNFAL